jgi:hypothetical protein
MVDRPSHPDTTFTLEVTTGSDAPATGRLFVAAVLRSLGRPESLIDDVKLVVSEALTAITIAGRADAAQVVLETDTGALRIGPIRRADLVDPHEPAFGLDLVQALFPGVHFDEDSLALIAFPVEPV